MSELFQRIREAIELERRDAIAKIESEYKRKLDALGVLEAIPVTAKTKQKRCLGLLREIEQFAFEYDGVFTIDTLLTAVKGKRASITGAIRQLVKQGRIEVIEPAKTRRGGKYRGKEAT